MLLAALACGGHEAIAPETETPPPQGVTISDPHAAVSALTAVTSGRSSISVAADVAYVSAAPGTISNGLVVKINNESLGGTKVTVQIVDGGFDPVPVPAGVGDKLSLTVITVNRDSSAFVVTVPPKRPPVIVRTNPARGRIDVALNQVITAVFSEPVDPRTFEDFAFRLTKNGIPVLTNLSVAADGLSASVTPVALLDPNTSYHVELTAQIRDLEGDPIAQESLDFTTGAPVSPVPSQGPSSVRIVFDRMDGTGTAHLYAMNGDGSDLVQLTTGPFSDTSPSVSPDGKQIAFVRGENVVVMNADGSDMRQVTTAGGMAPRWSPDGTKILFEAGTAIAFGDFKSTGLSVINTDGTGLVELTQASPDRIDGQANWSPDGQKIAFRRWEDLEWHVVWVMNADGSGAHRVGRFDGATIWACWGPIWSAGGKVVFVGPDNGLNMSIFEMNADGSDVGLLARFPNGAFVQRLDDRSVDGKWFSLTMGQLGSSTAKDVYLMTTAGSTLRITNDGRSSSAAFLSR
jgi:hypothetical protein